MPETTKKAFTSTILLNAPFWVMYAYLPFILIQELGATPFEIAIFFSLKPAVSLLSVYWSSYVANRGDRLIKNIVWSTVCAHLPILLFPFMTSTWYFIVAATTYILFERGGKPAWMELLKRNIESQERQKLFSKVATTSYSFGFLAPIVFGQPMDLFAGSWKWIFVATSCISLLSVFWQLKVPVILRDEIENVPVSSLKKPWQEAWRLLKGRKDFRKFQIGFFIAGSGTMIMQPAIPEFIVKNLNLSYTELGVAISLCKALGFATTSSLWAKLMLRIDLFRFLALVSLIMAFFPLLILGGNLSIFFIYGAYLLYGVMQAGSEMSWHLSGPLFANKEDSSSFTSIGVLLAGIRGLIFPLIGTYLLTQFSSQTPLLLGGFFALASAAYMTKAEKEPLRVN